MGNVYARLGPEVVPNIVLHFYISWCEYTKLDREYVPDDKTCTDILQKWHVPSESRNNVAILFFELTFIKADQQKEENNCRKPAFVTGERYFCATPLFDREVKKEKIEDLSKNRETNGLETDFAATLRDNILEPCSYFKTSITKNEKRRLPDISDIRLWWLYWLYEFMWCW